MEREADEQTCEDVGFDGVDGVEACLADKADEAKQAFHECMEETAKGDGYEENPPVGCWQFDGAEPLELLVVDELDAQARGRVDRRQSRNERRRHKQAQVERELAQVR